MVTNELRPNPEDCIICVKVGKVKRENLYEMTRKYWKVDINRARKATHVLAVVNGIVEEVYNPVDWKYTEDPKHIGRCEFLGVEDEHTTYIGKDVTAFYGKSQNPVKYINMRLSLGNARKKQVLFHCITLVFCNFGSAVTQMQT